MALQVVDEDLPVLKSGVTLNGSASLRENAVFIYSGGAEGDPLAVMLSTNAPAAEISVFNLDTTALIARGKGLVE